MTFFEVFCGWWDWISVILLVFESCTDFLNLSQAFGVAQLDSRFWKHFPTDLHEDYITP